MRLQLLLVATSMWLAAASVSAEPAPPADTDSPPTVISDNEQEHDATALVGDSWGGNGEGVQLGIINFRFLLQAGYAHTSAAASRNARATYRVAEDTLVRDGDGANLKRLFVRLGVEPSQYLELKSIVDLAEFVHDNADAAVKQAYVVLKPVPKHVELTVGVFKLPFSILELDPIANYRFYDPGEADALVKELGFAGRDIGAELVVAPLAKPKRLRLALGAFRAHARDENASPVGAIGARIESQPIKGLRFGLDAVQHPARIVYLNALETSSKDIVPDPADPQYPRAQTWGRGGALSADIKFQRYHVLAAVEGMIGHRVDADTRHGAKSFAAVWALAGYRFTLASIEWMPAIRAEWLDADREHPVGLRRMLSFALSADVARNVRVMLDVTHTDVQANSPLLEQPKPLPEDPYDELDNLRLAGQLQVAL